MSIWHVEACRHTQMRCIPPNWSQCFTLLRHETCGCRHTPRCKLIPVLQSPTTPCLFDMWKYADILKWDVSPQSNPSASEPYYTMSIWHVEACRHTEMRCISPNWNPVLQSPTTPCLFNMWKHADIPKWDVSSQSNPVLQSPTTQCFTCGSMQTHPNEMYPPKLIPVLHSPTTPCLFDMWKHADIPKWDVSSLIKPSHFEPYYTMSLWHVEACRHTQMRCISTNPTQCFQALLHHVCLTCGSMQTYPNEMYPPIKPSAS